MTHSINQLSASSFRMVTALGSPVGAFRTPRLANLAVRESGRSKQCEQACWRAR